MKYKIAVLSILILLTIFTPGCAKKDDGVLTLKLGHALDIEHPVHKALLFMKEKLNQNIFSLLKIQLLLRQINN